MKSRYLGGLFATMLAVATVIATVPPGAVATPNQAASSQDGRTLARAAAENLIESKAPQLKIGAHDAFVAKPVMSGGNGLHYAPYERTYRGLPVIGGDFVVVTDKAGHVLNTSVAQSRPTSLASVRPSVAKARALSVSRGQVDKVAATEAPRLVVWQGKTSHLAWESKVTGRDHGSPSIKSVYVDARSGKLLGSKEHVAEGTGNGNWEGSVTIPTSGSGTSWSMTNSNASTLKCQNSSGNVTFTGTDDVWGNGSATDRETGCVDALLLGREDAPDDVDVAGPQRHERLRRLGADPGRPQRRQRLLRRHPGADRPHPDRWQVDRLHGRHRARVRPRGRPP